MIPQVQADVFEEAEVDVWADALPESPLPAWVDEAVVVEVCAPAVPEPEPLVEFVDVDVDVDACAAGVVEAGWATVEPPAEVDEVVPVFV